MTNVIVRLHSLVRRSVRRSNLHIDLKCKEREERRENWLEEAGPVRISTLHTIASDRGFIDSFSSRFSRPGPVLRRPIGVSGCIHVDSISMNGDNCKLSETNSILQVNNGFFFSLTWQSFIRTLTRNFLYHILSFLSLSLFSYVLLLCILLFQRCEIIYVPTLCVEWKPLIFSLIKVGKRQSRLNGWRIILQFENNLFQNGVFIASNFYCNKIKTECILQRPQQQRALRFLRSPSACVGCLFSFPR